MKPDEARLIVLTNTWSQGGFYDRDGTRYHVEGECETQRCGAVCCKVSDITGVVGRQCEHLQADLRCAFHAQIGPAAKPISCLMWPLRPIDVDGVNAMAEKQGFKERCHLRVIES